MLRVKVQYLGRLDWDDPSKMMSLSKLFHCSRLCPVSLPRSNVEESL